MEGRTSRRRKRRKRVANGVEESVCQSDTPPDAMLMRQIRGIIAMSGRIHNHDSLL